MWLAPKTTSSSVNNDDYSDFSELDSVDDDVVDPRVQEELERLNNATDVINKLEVELDEARAAFRQLLCESTQKINTLANKLGSCVEKARPYYEARMKEKSAHSDAQKAALRFERANSAHAAAKEMVFLAEEGLHKEGRTFDPVWQEMLNHATTKVNEAEIERLISEQEHKRISKVYTEAEKNVQELKKDLKKSIVKSSPYFDMKAQFNRLMEGQKKCVQEFEENVLRAKQSYSDALHNLEEISDEIHQRRKRREKRLALGARGIGVGAENPEPSVQSENSAKHSECFMDLPSNLRLPKSLSSSTLSEIKSAAKRSSMPTASIVENHNYIKLKKSKSVVERTEASSLFGRYSISKNNKLQVDSESQTDESLLKSISIQSTEILTCHLTPPKLVSESKIARLDIPRDYSTPSSKSASIQSSENNSPTNQTEFGCTNKRRYSLPVTEEGILSDTESLASVDGLTDDQISCLMFDKELEEVIENLNWKTRIHDRLEGSPCGTHQMTQTAETEHAAASIGEQGDDSDDEITIMASSTSSIEKYNEN